MKDFRELCEKYRRKFEWTYFKIVTTSEVGGCKWEDRCIVLFNMTLRQDAPNFINTFLVKEGSSRDSFYM